MKKLLIICLAFVVFGYKNASAQTPSFPDPNTGTSFYFHDDGAGSVEAQVNFADGMIVSNVTGTTNKELLYAAIEVVGIDSNNNEIPIMAVGVPTFTSAFNGLNYISATGSNSNPDIVKIEVILLAQYHDFNLAEVHDGENGDAGDYEEEMDMEYFPDATGCFTICRPGA